MPGETKEDISGWTTDTLKQHYDALRQTDKDALAAALQAVKEENQKIALAFEKRFDSVNEFRRALSDQTNTFLPRPEYAANHKSLEDRIDTKYGALADKVALLTDRMNQDKGQEISMGKIYAAIGAVGVILGVIVLLANNVF